jgi:hypothetical protein
MPLALRLSRASLAVCATAAGAAPYDRRHARAHTHGYALAHRYRNDDTLAGDYEHGLDAVRFGSQRWWHIHEEQRGGRRR